MQARISGVVVRWGLQGFGFIRSTELPADAYFNRSFVGEPAYLPREGDTVTFEPLQLPDGKFQARRVTGPAREAVAARDARPANRGNPFSAVAQAEFDRALTRLPAPGAAAPAAPARTLAERLEGSRKARDEAWGRQEALKARAQARVETHRGRLEEIRRQLAETERQAAEAERDVEEARAAAEGLLERAGADEIGIVGDWIGAQARRVADTLSRRRTEAKALEEARARAAGKAGPDALQRYEEVRRRLRSAPDALSREAFAALEAAQRPRMEEFARALEALDQRSEEGVTVLGFLPAADDPDPALLLVAGLRSGDALLDPEWRALAAFWQAADRALSELAPGSEPEYGSVAGSPAIRARGRISDPELAEMAFNLALDEAWTARPSLGLWKLLPVFESAAAGTPPFAPEEVPPAARRDALPPESGGSLPEVARSLRLPFREVASAVVALGLAHADDVISAEGEATLRHVLGLASPPPPRPAAAGSTSSAPAAPSRAREIAARLLGKLFRDRRIGGRHTAVENAWAHHFSEAEKECARELTERLIRRGWLREKFNNGARHISIEPGEMARVLPLIEGRVDDPALFKGLE